MKIKLTKKARFTLIALSLIVFLAIWVRTYNYHEWLFFKWDQARDATILSLAIENGPGELPLLAPRAAKADGDYLRLGPAYYYTQYLSGVIFQSTSPDVFAYPDLLFSILTIPLLFLFLRLYFSRNLSLISTTLYAGSFIIIQHSRFSWNPNSLPFFILLALYGLLRFTAAKKFKHKLGWISLWAFAFAIASQYHFFGLFSLTATSGAFLLFFAILEGKASIFTREKFTSLRKLFLTKSAAYYSLVAILIIGFLYLPVILSETKTDWNNTKRFISVVADRSDIDEEVFETGKKSKTKTFSEKLVRNFREQAKGYSLITIGKSHRQGNKADPITVTFGTILLFGSLLLAFWQIRKEKKSSKRNFLLILILWSGLFFIITIPNAYQLRPRYFAPIFPVPFIMLALWFSFLAEFKNKKLTKYYWFIVGLIALLVLNIRETKLWFKEQADSQTKSIETNRTFILKRQDGITLGQLERVTNHLYKQRNQGIVVFNTKPEYKTPVKYLLAQKKDPTLKSKLADRVSELEGHNTLFFVVTKRGGTKSVKKEIRPFLSKISEKQFGQLMVFEMKIDQEKVTAHLKMKAIKAAQNKKEPEIIIEKIPRLFWKDFVGNKKGVEHKEIRNME